MYPFEASFSTWTQAGCGKSPLKVRRQPLRAIQEKSIQRVVEKSPSADRPIGNIARSEMRTGLRSGAAPAIGAAIEGSVSNNGGSVTLP
jgi:hypothetical protein